MQNKWSKKYDQCQKCGSDKSEHKAKGLCNDCYNHIRTLRRRKYFREYRRVNPQVRLTSNKSGGLINYQHKGTSIGFLGEERAINWLNAKRNNNRFIDLDWNGKKVDVKTSRPHPLTYKKTKTKRWKFSLKQKGVADLFLIICLNSDETVYKAFLIPDNQLKVKNISFTENTIKKYAKFFLTSE